MKAAKDAGDECYDPTREDNNLERNETRVALWEGHLEDPIVALDKALKCVENSYLRSRPECLVEGALQWRALASSKGCGKSRSGRAFGPTSIRWIVCVCLRTASMEWFVPGKHGLFLIKKEPATMRGSETFSPFFNADIRTTLFVPPCGVHGSERIFNELI